MELAALYLAHTQPEFSDETTGQRLRHFMDPVSAFGIAASAAQFTELAANLFLELFKYFQTVKRAPKLSKELREEAHLVHKVLEELKSTLETVNIPSSVTPTLNDVVEKFTKTMDELKNRIEVKEGDIIKRLKWPFTEQENKEYISKLERYKNTFTLALSTIQSQKLGRIDEGVRRIDNRTQNLYHMILDSAHNERQEKRYKILEWISSADISSRHKSVSNERVKNSGTWFLQSDAYRNWLKGTASNVLCCQGIPGAGKTFLISLAIDDITNTIAEDNARVAYMYFDYKNREGQTGENVIRILLKQLLLPSNLIPPDLESAYDKCRSHHKDPDKGIFTRQLLSTAATFSSVYVMLDALDECSDETFKDILALIHLFKNSGTKIFCTSRPHITNLRDQLKTSIVLIDAHDEDVRNYLTVRLNKEWRHDKSLREPIIDRLVQDAKGKFLLVKFQLDYILDKEKPRDAIKALDTLPTDMESAYHEVLVRIDKAKGTDTARQILSWLFHAQRPLHIDELREVLSIETRPPDTQLFPQYFISPDRLIHLCQGLIEFDETGGIVRFTHYTVQEFLKKKYQDKLLSPTELAKVCLTYLTFDIFELGPCSDQELFNRRMKTHRFSEYAIRYWGCYARGKGEEEYEVLDILFKLFKSSQKRSALRQLKLFIQKPWLKTSNLSILTSSPWMPLHIIAQEGLIIVYNLISNPHKKPPISAENEMKVQHLTSSFESIELGTIDSRDDAGSTALHHAAENGHKEMAIALLEHDADVNAQDNHGRTALHRAAENGHKEAVIALLEHAANIDAQDDYGWTALRCAAKNGHKDTVITLLERDADVNVKDNNGWTALHSVAENGHKDIVIALLEYYADINSQDEYRWTALYRAAKNGHKDTVMALLEYDADINARDEYGWTALYRAAENGHKDTVIVLLEHDADVNSPDNNGLTALHCAAENGQKDSVIALVEHDADVNAQDEHGWTALHRAAENGHKDTVIALLEYDADINAQDEYGRTALYLAAKNGHKDTVIALLEHDADVNSQDKCGWTVLRFAAEYGHKDTVMALLER